MTERAGSAEPPKSSSERTKTAHILRRWPAWSLLLSWLLLGCQVLFGGVKVTESAASDRCKLGDFRCNDEYLLSCGSQDTGWSLKSTCASGDLCDAKDKRCSVCKDGDFRCAGAERQQCASDGSRWNTVETCAAENVCSESSCMPCLSEGELDCSVAPQLRRCQAGVWVTLDTCGSQALCKATTAYATTASDWDQKCVALGCPQAGQYRCEGAILERCPPDQVTWLTVDTCASSALCDGAVAAVNTATDPNATALLDMCKPGCPSAGAFVCDGATLKQCLPDQTGYAVIKVCPPDTECDPTGDCGQLCSAGHFQCNAETLRKCDATGHWMDEAKCDSSALCLVNGDGTTGSCSPSRCGNQPYICSGAALQKCRDDKTGYDASLTCVSAPLCDAQSARCIDPICPKPNEYRCDGQDLKQCAPDQTKWNPVTTCPAGQYCSLGSNPGCMTSCPATPERCNGKVLEHCDPATGWTTQATCQTADLCSCTLTDPDGPGPLTNSCLLGLYSDGCGNVVCGVSKANFQCSGAKLQKCQAGRNGWDDMTTCASADLCYPGVAPTYLDGACLTCPTAGELSCSGSTLRVCSNDRRTWATSQTCTLGCKTVANGQDYCAACAAGVVQCSGATLQSCPADQRAFTSTSCGSAALCDKTNNQCDLCTQTVCAGNVLQKCTNGGQTLQNQTCASVCDATNAQCDSCVANSFWCTGATLNKCSADGQSQTSTVCLTAGLCDATNKLCQPAQCAVGQRRCDPSNPAALQICNAQRNGWDPVATCATGPLCSEQSNGVCAAPKCAVGERSCGGPGLNLLQLCNAARDGWDALGTCASAALCDISKPACITPACPVGDVICAGAQPQICNPGRTAYMNNGMLCASGCSNGVCNGCTANQKTCSGAQPQICADDLSGFTNNGPACVGVACNPGTGSCNACTANQKKCTGAQPQICSPSLTSFVDNGSACDSAALCDPTTFTCDACLTGQHQCLGTNSQICNDAQSGFVDGTECGLAGCNTMTNACNTVVCGAGTFRCVGTGGLDLQQCNAGGTAWGALQTCVVICDAVQGECDECVAPAFECLGTVLQDCSPTGHWELKQDCAMAPTTTCNAGVCQ